MKYKAMKQLDQEEAVVRPPLKGTKIDHKGPPHLWPNEFANNPTFRRFKGDSKASAIKDPNKRPEQVKSKRR